MTSFKLGVTIWSLGPTLNWRDLERQLAIVKDLSAEGVQLWAVDYSPRHPCLLDPDRCGSECRSARHPFLPHIVLNLDANYTSAFKPPL